VVGNRDLKKWVVSLPGVGSMRREMQDVEFGLGGLGDEYSGETREGTTRTTSGNPMDARCARRKKSGMPQEDSE
jgi:hypothetical protein